MKGIIPYPWQKEARDNWISEGHKGLVEAATGTGKTFFGLNCYDILEMGSTLLVVVPTTVLQQQWEKEIKEVLNISSKDIGLLGDGSKQIDKKITIAIINSLRNVSLEVDMIIIDEAHRCCSKENFTAIKQQKWGYFLGMSATIEREDEEHERLLELAKIIYTIDQKEAIKKGYISPYDIVNVGVDLGPTARRQYDYYQDIINKLFPRFHYDYALVMKEMYSDVYAKQLFCAFNKRKMILNNSVSKILKSVEVIKYHCKKEKIIVFNELVKVTDVVTKLLKKEGVNVGVLQSRHKAKERRKIIEDYDTGKFNVLVCCRVLDEGLNIKDATMGVIVSGNSTRRQGVQRTGRLLRPMEGKKAKLFNIYVKNSQDVVWLNKRLKGLSGYDKIYWI